MKQQINCKVAFTLTEEKWMKMHEQSRRVYDVSAISPTIHTMGGGGQEIKIMEEKQPRYRIRKLTPREAFRLMDVEDADIDKIQESGISNSQQYKMAGNSIVVSVLYGIFKNAFVNTEPPSGTQLTMFG